MQDGFVKVALRVPHVRVADVDHNVEACLEAIREAADAGAKVIALPELCVTGATCADLFWNEGLVSAATAGVVDIADRTIDVDALIVVGSPVRVGSSLYDCAVAIAHGDVVGIVPKRHLSAAEARHFAAGPQEPVRVGFDDQTVSFGARQVFGCDTMPDLVVAFELGADLEAPLPPSTAHALAGASIVVNLAAQPVLVGSAEATRARVADQSKRLGCAYAWVGAGAGESTTDYVFGGQCVVAQCGTLLAEAAPFGAGAVTAVVDVERVVAERRRMPAITFESTFGTLPEDAGYWGRSFSLFVEPTELAEGVNASPFVPRDASARPDRYEEILDIQAHALAGRMDAIGSAKAVVGISGGLDSTLALLVAARAFDLLGLDRAGITAITMPGFGTTDRTHNNAWQLTEALGATPREIPIGASVRQHFADIDHDESVHNAAYENAQARERTQILMDVANDIGAIVVGTGDLSELALGWATYNGDHMSMYAVNAAVPKTLIRHVVRHVAETCGNAREREVLLDVLDTPVSPELLPANDDGTIAQQTEDLVGPYELHDFFVYQLLRYGFSAPKIYRLACAAFAGTYDETTILTWLRVFCRRFFSQQFKRSCAPDGPAVGSVGLSPRGGLVMPSDAASALWLSDLEELGKR